jgi:hypothetical protein
MNRSVSEESRGEGEVLVDLAFEARLQAGDAVAEATFVELSKTSWRMRETGGLELPPLGVES